MAITQTIKIETEGADKVAEQFKAIGTAVEQSAEQIKKVGDASGGGFEKAEKAAESFGQKVQGLGTTLGQLGIGDQIGGAVSKIGEAASTAAPAITGLKQAAVGAATGMAEFGKGLLTAFTSTSQTGAGLTVVASGLTKVGAAASATAGTAGTLGVALQAASLALGPFSGSLGSLVSILGVVGGALTTFAAAVPLVTAAIAAATPAIVAFAAAIGPVALVIIGITIVLAAVAAAVYYFGGAARENTAALKELSEATGRSVEALRRQQDAFVAAGGSAKTFIDVMKAAGLSVDELARKQQSAAEDQRVQLEKLQAAELKALEAKKAAAATGQADRPKFTLEDDLRRLDLIRQQSAATSEGASKVRDWQRAQEEVNKQAAVYSTTVASIGQLLERAAKGAKDVKLPVDVPAATLIEAWTIKLNQAKQSGQDFDAVLRQIISNLSAADARKFGEALKIPETEIEKIQALDQATKGWGQTLLEIAIRANGLLRGLPLEEINGQLNAVRAGAAAAKTSVDAVGTSAATAQTSVATAATTPADGAWAWVSSTFDSVLKSLQGATATATSFITTWVTTPIANAWTWLLDSFKSVTDAITTWFNDRLAAWKAMFDRMRSSGGSSGGDTAAAPTGAGLARGGLLGGRGSGTSDSNLAWVSRGEYITPARAVSQPGVLAFLEALRRSGGNLRDVLDGMGRFALGGMVAPRLSLSAFAGGVAMNNVTIQFPGLPEITGLRASSAVVDELRKAAALAQVRSGGRKPSRYS